MISLGHICNAMLSCKYDGYCLLMTRDSMVAFIPNNNKGSG